jgi:hypothetical protein
LDLTVGFTAVVHETTQASLYKKGKKKKRKKRKKKETKKEKETKKNKKNGIGAGGVGGMLARARVRAVVGCLHTTRYTSELYRLYCVPFSLLCLFSPCEWHQ